MERRRRGQESQVSSDRNWVERRERDGLGGSNDASEGWSGADTEDSAEAETEEDGMTVGEPEGIGIRLMALLWGTQESGTVGLQGGARSSRSEVRRERHRESSLRVHRRGGGAGPPWGEDRARRK